MKSITSTVKLNNNVDMPIFGLGLYRSKTGNETQQAIQWAHDSGYIMFDTAQIYGNEQDLGRALKNLEIGRENVWITTKLWRENLGNNLVSSFEKSLEKLQLEFVDLLLIHWPKKDKKLDAWDQMTKLLDEGRARSIGVSNFMTWHIKEILENSSVVPQVNQCEFSPYLHDPDLLKICKENKIQFEAYSPLTKGQKLKDPKLVEIANKYNKSPAQILIRWGLEQNAIQIPKSVKKERIKENSEIFDFSLSKDDFNEMNSWNIDLVTGWNPWKQD
ncbi:MAG: aldo/keto reductase [Candidatus Heimdallarchaeota archaeon]